MLRVLAQPILKEYFRNEYAWGKQGGIKVTLIVYSANTNSNNYP